jgi:hypothetical protein
LGPPPAAATAGGELTAIEIELVSMPKFVCSNNPAKGCNVDGNCGAGNTCIEGTSFTGEGGVRYAQLIGEVEDSEVLGTTMWAAVLSCEADYQDWAGLVGTNILYVTGAEIVPKGMYNVRRLAASCQGAEANCPAKSEPLAVSQTGWGDVNSDGALNVSDVSNEVDLLKGLPSGHLPKYKGQVQPNAADPTLKPSVQDLSAVVDPTKGIPYPYPGPCACPSTTACAPTTACTSTATCVAPRRCVSGSCSLVDACGRCLP